MNDMFEKKLRAAAVAGWWTLLVGVIFLLIQWMAYLYFTNAKPDWLMRLWGPDISWAFIQDLWFWMAGIFKLCLWLMALVVLWLTLWARQLR